ncbi:hypothetical protein ABZP36_031135 [Zizania latifolia]
MFLEVIMAATELDMEAAEQLIQLSGCGGDESLESRSTESVSKKSYAMAAAAGRKEEDKEAAVESCSRKRDATDGEEAGDEFVIGGEAPRRRPRFRSLAAVYRGTRRLGDDDVARCRTAAAEAEYGERTTTTKKRATDAAAGEAAVPVAANK